MFRKHRGIQFRISYHSRTSFIRPLNHSFTNKTSCSLTVYTIDKLKTNFFQRMAQYDDEASETSSLISAQVVQREGHSPEALRASSYRILLIICQLRWISSIIYSKFDYPNIELKVLLLVVRSASWHWELLATVSVA